MLPLSITFLRKLETRFREGVLSASFVILSVFFVMRAKKDCFACASLKFPYSAYETPVHGSKLGRWLTAFDTPVKVLINNSSLF